MPEGVSVCFFVVVILLLYMFSKNISNWNLKSKVNGNWTWSRDVTFLLNHPFNSLSCELIVDCSNNRNNSSLQLELPDCCQGWTYFLYPIPISLYPVPPPPTLSRRGRDRGMVRNNMCMRASIIVKWRHKANYALRQWNGIELSDSEYQRVFHEPKMGGKEHPKFLRDESIDQSKNDPYHNKIKIHKKDSLPGKSVVSQFQCFRQCFLSCSSRKKNPILSDPALVTQIYLPS